MKTFYSAQEIEDLARQGVRELVVDDNVVLTDLARQMAGQLGLRLVTGHAAAAPRPAADGARAAQAQTPVQAQAPVATAAAQPAKPRGCQHGPLAAGSNGRVPQAAAVANGSAGGQLVDDLVGLVKQMSKR